MNRMRTYEFAWIDDGKTKTEMVVAFNYTDAKNALKYTFNIDHDVFVVQEQLGSVLVVSYPALE